MNFTLPSYNGARYRVQFRVKVDSDVANNTNILNTANWTEDGNAMASASDTLYVREAPPANAGLYLYKGGPTFASEGDYINYKIYFRNTGTVPLINLEIDDVMPPEFDLSQIYVVSSTLGMSLYSVKIKTSEAPTVDKVVINNGSGTTGPIDLIPYIPTGERVLSIKLESPEYKVTTSLRQLVLFGTVNDKVVDGQVVTNTASYSADSSLGAIKGTNSHSFTVDEKSFLNVRKSLSPSKPTYTTLDEISFTLSYFETAAALRNPVIIDVLPPELKYVPDSYSFSLYDVALNKTVYSTDPNYPLPVIAPEVIEDYPNAGETTLRWNFDGTTIPYNTRFMTRFKAYVAISTASGFENYGYVGNKGDDASVSNGYARIIDIDDLDNDGFISEQIAKSNVVSGVVLTSSEFVIEKEVKGELAIDFGAASTTQAGGGVEYVLRVRNNQPTELKDIELVDILPHIGDTGVILETTPRLSEFEVYSTAMVTAELRDILTGDTMPTNDIVIEYSQSYDPVRFGETLNSMIGTVNDWTVVPPIDLTTIKAIKVTTGSTIILKPYDELLVKFSGKAPIGVTSGAKAYNSFAVKAVNDDGNDTPLLPVEPNKVRLTIVNPSGASIGDFVWKDENRDGLQDVNEVGINGVIVELYDDNDNLLASTITANNNQNEAGYYIFNNLEEGDYYVKFIPNGEYELTVQKESDANGSKPNKTTGITSVIELAKNQKITNIDAGVVIPATTAHIGNFVWIDEDGDGVNTPEEVGINGVVVNLYDENDNKLRTTITVNDPITNEAGYYLFEDALPGNYYVEFMAPTSYSITNQREDLLNGSKPDEETGQTSTFAHIAGLDNLIVDAGLVPCQQPPTIDAENVCLYEGATYDPLANVTAKNCDGTDIPMTGIDILSNNVDTSTAGIYEVELEATSTTNGTKATKKIYVRVNPTGVRHQAVNDLVQSVALEQTALSNILNAEGKKIQKALDLNLSAEDIISINKSVECMVDTITSLEIVLKQKISHFNCNLCNKCEFPTEELPEN